MAELEYLMDYARQKGEIAALKNAANTIKGLRETLNQIADIIPGSHEELGIVHDVQAFVQRTQELEAQAAAMREALEPFARIEAFYKTIEQADQDGLFKGVLTLGGYRSYLDKATKALASDAGRDLLERVKKLKAAADVLNGTMHVLDMIRLSASWCDFPPSAQNMVIEALLEGKAALAALEGGEQDA